jgi:diguanylate cyclase (GGDEF)-like protein
MHLDIPTLMVMGSFVAACAGVVLLIAWTGDRKTPALAIWGLGHVCMAIGIFALMLALEEPEALHFALAGNVLVLGHGLIWKAIRSFDSKPAPLAFALLGVALTAAAGAIPQTQHFAGALGYAADSIYLFAAAGSLWPNRQEPLPARWPLFFFTVVHAVVMVFGARYAFYATVQYQTPPLLSLFGLVHFEGIVFSVATAVFMLALVKERSEAASRAAALIDSLTGIANRAAFVEKATRAFERCRHDKTPVAVIMFDLDSFKAINDNHGHAVGDIVLRKFCEVASAALRPSDVFGRLGGEEFAAVLPRSDIEPAYVRAERIRLAFAEECGHFDGHHLNATVSGGVAVSADAAMTMSELLAYADRALYRAKAGGRNCIKRDADATPADGPAAVVRVA